MTIITPLPQLALTCPQGRILGMDVGTKTLGLALTDETQIVASPLCVIRRSKWQKDALTLQSLWADHNIKAIILGLPLHMQGTESRNSQSVRAFAVNLQKIFTGPLCLWDERLSTLAVQRAMLEADLSRKKRAAQVDQLAATYILQGALEKIRHIRAQEGP